MHRERRTKDVRTLHSVDLDVTTQMPASDTSSWHQNEYLVWHWNLLVKGDSQRFPLKQFEAQKIGATLSSYEQLWSSKTVCLDGPKCFKGSSDSVFHCRSRFVANQQLKSIASSLASAVCAGRDHNCKPFSDVPWKHRNETWQKCLPVRRFCKGAILMQRIPALWDTTRCTGHASAGVWSRFPQRGADLYRRVSMGFIHASPTTCAVSDRLQFYSHFLNSVWMGLEYTESWLGTPTCTKTCAAQVNMRTMKTSRVFHCTSALDKLILRFCFRWCRMFFITREWRGEIATVVMFLQNRWVAIDPTTWEWKIPILPPLIFSQLKDSRPQQPVLLQKQDHMGNYPPSLVVPFDKSCSFRSSEVMWQTIFFLRPIQFWILSDMVQIWWIIFVLEMHGMLSLFQPAK